MSVVKKCYQFQVILLFKKRNFNAETQAILGVHAIEEYQEIKQENR